jgi:hypothetical protein
MEVQTLTILKITSDSGKAEYRIFGDMPLDVASVGILVVDHDEAFRQGVEKGTSIKSESP